MNQSEDQEIVAAIDFTLSSDHVLYVVHAPSVIDWVGFIGGVAVIVFLVGKLVN